MRGLRFPHLPCFLLALLACSDPGGPPVVVSKVTIAPDSIAIERGTTSLLTATAIDSSGHPVAGAMASWSSVDTAITTVTAGGLVTGRALGRGRVVAAVGARADTALVEVVIAIGAFRVFPDTITLVPGASVPVAASAYDSLGGAIADPGTRWVSLDTSLASVDADGRVTGRAVGETSVVATAGLRSDTVVVRVATVTLTAVTGGFIYHTCGLTADGAAFCWGFNDAGKLGTGSLSEQAPFTRPVGVFGGLRFRSISPGGPGTCALTTGGHAYCWGLNILGSLGLGAESLYVTPTPMAGNRSFAVLTLSGGLHGCALTTAGEAWCWGLNQSGELGAPPSLSSTVPIPVSTTVRFTDIGVGQGSTCGLGVDSLVYCWGYNVDGRLGDSTTASRSTPAPVHGGRRFRSLSVGFVHACAVTADSAAFCWGDNYFGELGDSTFTNSSIPIPVRGGLKFAGLSAGRDHTCGLTGTGDGYCWGWNVFGELGTGTTYPNGIATPQRVAGGRRFVSISQAHLHTCGVTTDSIAVCWGFNNKGQLGTGDTLSVSSPAPVASRVGSAQSRLATLH